MKLKQCSKAKFLIHETPDEEIKASTGTVEIKFWDSEDRRQKIEFKGYLDFKYHKMDAYQHRDTLYRDRAAYSLEEVVGSSWLQDALKTLKKNNTLEEWSWKGDFHHYRMVFHDSVCEIIAYDDYEIIDTNEQAEWTKYDYEIENRWEPYGK